MKRRFCLLAVSVTVATFLLVSCHSHDTTNPPQGVSVSLNLPSANVSVSGQLQFTATVTGTTNAGVTWSVDNVVGGNSTVGTIDTTGLYTAPAVVPTPATVILKATSVADPTKSATSTITIQVGVTVSLNLASATVNVSSQQQFSATVNGTTDTGVTWSVDNIVGGNSTVGTINASGLYTAPAAVPTSATVTVKATSVADPTKSATVTVTIQASAGFLPGTGQTTSYATGDDGDSRKGTAWPNPRFTVGTGPEADCVRDNLTGLMWVKGPDSTKRTWANALSYANGLSLCGYDDWRLPNRKELWSLIDFSKARPPLPDGNPFTNVQADYYWTSTSWRYTDHDPFAEAWHFSMSSGETGGGSDKGTPRYVWPVRSAQIGAVALPQTGQTLTYASGDDGELEKGAAWPIPRFIAGTGSEADCITDNLTGLMWVRNPDQFPRTWADALAHANGLVHCGYDDWRLPNINELESVEHLGVEDGAAWLNSQGFSGLVTPSGCTYWSSTTYADNTDFAWRVGLCSGNVGADGWYKTTPYYVWPVRSGAGQVSASVTTLASVNNAGIGGDGSSTSASISLDGRYVAFASMATNMGATNGYRQVYVRDRQAGNTILASVDNNGIDGGNGNSGLYDVTSISADGRFVAFTSAASNLVAGDTNGWNDVFVYDRQAGQVKRVSVLSNGDQANNDSYDPSISGNGRYVAFTSEASNLDPSDSNTRSDIFVHDLQAGQTTRVSVSSAGAQGDGNSYLASISANGRYVMFVSKATNLVSNDTNNREDVFVHDRDVTNTGTFDTPGNIGTTRVNVNNAGNQQTNGFIWGAKISANGLFVVFSSEATNLIVGDTTTGPDVYLHDLQTSQTTVVSVSSAGIQGDTSCVNPSISQDGRYVVFESQATNLVPGHTGTNWDVFVRDRNSGQTSLVSLNNSGTQGNGWSEWPAISGDGRFVAFESDATNLIPGDTSGFTDVFVRQLQ